MMTRKEIPKSSFLVDMSFKSVVKVLMECRRAAIQCQRNDDFHKKKIPSGNDCSSGNKEESCAAVD